MQAGGFVMSTINQEAVHISRKYGISYDDSLAIIDLSKICNFEKERMYYILDMAAGLPGVDLWTYFNAIARLIMQPPPKRNHNGLSAPG
jgi:hypothetical protein